MLPAVFTDLQLQPQAAGAMTILRLLAASSPNWPEVALVVARDPALSLALLIAQPLAAGELNDGLNSVLRRRLERLGADLLRAWLLGLGNANTDCGSAPDRALLRAECALHLAIETRYPRPDEAYLAGLWRGFGHARRPLGETRAAGVETRAQQAQELSKLIRDCGLPASLGDALELGAVMEEQLKGTHPLLALAVAAERLAYPHWQEHLPEVARLTGLHEGVLSSMRTDVAYIVAGHAAYPAPSALPCTSAAHLPATANDDPYRSAGMLGLLTAAFFVHVVSGNRFYTAACPGRNAAADKAYEAWLMGRCGVQMITADLALGAVFLLLLGFGAISRNFQLELFLLLTYGGWFLLWLVSLGYERAAKTRYLRLCHWALFLTVALLVLLGM